MASATDQLSHSNAGDTTPAEEEDEWEDVADGDEGSPFELTYSSWLFV